MTKLFSFRYLSVDIDFLKLKTVFFSAAKSQTSDIRFKRTNVGFRNGIIECQKQ